MQIIRALFVLPAGAFISGGHPITMFALSTS